MSPCVCIAGPTASGKSALALAVAEQVGGEIISVDSMQVYRGLDIGTAKPTSEEQRRVPHHLIDVVDLTEPFDAARFVGLASEAEKAIRARRRVPIFCGGTGLYFRAYFEGLGNAPSPDPAMRSELERAPLAELLEELRQRDPETFLRIDRNNPRRIVRAIEAIRLTGRPFSQLRAQWGAGQGAECAGGTVARFFGVARAADDLRHRIDRRVDEMFAHGLVDETRELLHHGLSANPTAMQAIGYRQVVQHLQGEHDLAATINLVKTKTRQYAKRQMTWFRRQPNVEWLEPCEVLRQVAAILP